MKKLLFLSALLLALAGQAWAQTASVADIVVVRIVEYGDRQATTIITRNEHQSEVSEFRASSFKTASQELNENTYRVIHQLYKEGYALQAMTNYHEQREIVFVKLPH